MYDMRKITLVIATIFSLSFLMACTRLEPEEEPENSITLIFNTPEVVGGMLISPAGSHDFHLPVSNEQLDIVLPVIGATGYEWSGFAMAYYQIDGTLVEMSAQKNLTDDDIDHVAMGNLR